MTTLTTQQMTQPGLRFRIDSFTVPAATRDEFDAAARRNMDFIERLPGFLGHTVFEQLSGPSSFNVVTIASWADQAALDAATVEVRAFYARIGFDPAALCARLGITAELGNYRAAGVTP